jgi:hypothetical protein
MLYTLTNSASPTVTVAVKVTVTLPVAGSTTAPVSALITALSEDTQTMVASNAPVDW